MPADFPAWGRVYAFFRRWREHGLIAEFHDRPRGRVREREGREAEPSAGITDAQSVRAAASVPAASRGYDDGKKVAGRKRHIVTDTLGLLLVVAVTAANVGDRDDAAVGLLGRLRRLHLKKIRSRWRKLPPGRIALIVLAVLRHDQRLSDMAGGNEVSASTVRRCPTDQNNDRAPGLLRRCHQHRQGRGHCGHSGGSASAAPTPAPPGDDDPTGSTPDEAEPGGVAAPRQPEARHTGQR